MVVQWWYNGGTIVVGGAMVVSVDISRSLGRYLDISLGSNSCLRKSRTAKQLE